MERTKETAFDDESIHSVRKLASEYQFQVGKLETVITIRLYEEFGERGGYSWEQSHHIHTPTQAGPYHTSRPWGDNAAYALQLAVSGITMYFQQAVKAGYAPEEGWLVPNKRFNA